MQEAETQLMGDSKQVNIISHILKFDCSVNFISYCNFACSLNFSYVQFFCKPNLCDIMAQHGGKGKVGALPRGKNLALINLRFWYKYLGLNFILRWNIK